MTGESQFHFGRSSQLEDTLKPKITVAFLETLVQASRTCGWSVDLVEVNEFVRWCHNLAEVPIPEDLNAFESDADFYGHPPCDEG